MSDSGPTLHDAYRKWLKIADSQFPPDHYAILGLPRFESDAAKIQHATLERMKIVRPKCFKYHELGTQLLNQIAKANVCLSNSAEKAAYDRSLQTGSVTAAVQSAGNAAGEDRARLQQLLDEALRELKAVRAAKEQAGGQPPAKPAYQPVAPPPDDDFELSLSLSDTDDESFELTLDDSYSLSAGDSDIDFWQDDESELVITLDDGDDFDLSLDDDFDLSLDDDFDGDDAIERNVRRLLEEERRYRQRSQGRPRTESRWLSGRVPDANPPERSDPDEVDADELVAATPAKPLTEDQKALLLVGFLTATAVAVIGGLIAYNTRGSKQPDAALDAQAGHVLPASQGPGDPAGQSGAQAPGPDYYGMADYPQPGAGTATADPYAGAAGSGLSGGAGSGSEASFPGVPSPTPRKPATVAPIDAPLERFVGTLVRVEQRARQLVLSVQVTSADPYRDDPDLPQPPDVRGASPLAFNAVITAIVEDPAFAKNVFDYQSLEEAVDEVLATGRPGDFLNGDGGAAFSGDSVELIGWRIGSGDTSVALAPGGVAVRLRSIKKVGQPDTLALADEPRLGALDTSVHDRRTPLRKLLRGWNTGFDRRAAVTGSVLDASNISHVRFQPDLTALPIVVNAATLNFAGQSLLTEFGGQLQLTLMFAGAFDDLGQPVLHAISIARSDVGAAAGPGGEVNPAIPATRGFDEPEPTYLPAADPYVEERWYVIRIPDPLTKTVDYVAVYGEQAKKDTIADYRAIEIKAYAVTTSFKTEDEAYAYIERVQARRMPRNAFP